MGNNYLEQLNNKLDKKPIIFIGELHGAKANIDVINLIFKNNDIDIILLELEAKWNAYLEKLKNNDEKYIFKKISNENWVTESGLIGKEHLILFKKLLKHHKKIIAIKKEDKDWNRAENKTVKNIIGILNKNKEKKFLLVMGNLHARKNKFKLPNDKLVYKPVGFYLKKLAVFIRIRYGSGKLRNFGVIDYFDKEAKKILKNKNYKIIPSTSKFFDYDILIKKTTPIKLIKQ